MNCTIPITSTWFCRLIVDNVGGWYVWLMRICNSFTLGIWASGVVRNFFHGMKHKEFVTCPISQVFVSATKIIPCGHCLGWTEPFKHSKNILHGNGNDIFLPTSWSWHELTFSRKLFDCVGTITCTSNNGISVIKNILSTIRVKNVFAQLSTVDCSQCASDRMTTKRTGALADWLEQSFVARGGDPAMP